MIRSKKVYRELHIPYEFLKIVEEVIEEELLKNPDGIELPEGLGTIQIRKFAPKNTPYIRHAYKKKSINIDATDGYMLTLVLSNSKYMFSHMNVYHLTPYSKAMIRRAVPYYYRYYTLY